MSSKYFSIEYSGLYSNVQSFLISRGWSAEVKNVGGNKLYLKISEDSVEELKYCKDMELDDLKGGKINQIKEILEHEFQNFSENGFEIIHDPHHVNKLTNEKQKFEINKQESQREEKFEYPKFIQEEQSKVHDEEETKEEIRDRIANALTDTILPSKTPLHENDPFLYLTSPGYLKTFFFASTLIIFVLALID